jgi:hypothetical protein
MVFTIDKAKDTAKARLLDEYMRTGDLAALVKAYTDLKAKPPVPVPVSAPATPVRDAHKENTGYTYFDVTF